MLNQHQTIKDNIAKYNKENLLVPYLVPFIGNKKEIKILDVGSGPYSIIGDFYPGIDIEITHCDNQDFTKFWKKYNATPAIKVEYQNMENLTYNWDYYDIVCCINALDHTRDALMAVQEMIRVCKPGGYVYIDCHLDQMDTGHKHKWNANKEGVFTNNKGGMFDLKLLGFQITYIDNGGESRYNKIIATLQKS